VSGLPLKQGICRLAVVGDPLRGLSLLHSSRSRAFHLHVGQYTSGPFQGAIMSPMRQLGACRQPGCLGRATNRGYCSKHIKDFDRRDKERRGSSAQRGYDKHWQELRAQYFTAAGIPKSEWSRYRLHHRPRYDPNVDPVHEHYELTVMSEEQHNAITAREDHDTPQRRRYTFEQRWPTIG
jgi:hypothetical protein